MGETATGGALTEAVFYILLALHEPMHGYGIMKRVRELSNDRLALGPGTLYGALTALLERGWIEMAETPEEGRKKDYCITEAGRQAVRHELLRLRELLDNGLRVTGGMLE